MMNEPNTLYVTNRKDWRAWLKNHFDTEKSIWLVYPKKASGKPRISYNDAVEEALCFGWIDSQTKSLDANNTIQRFTPRNPKSSYSQQNKERMKWPWETIYCTRHKLKKPKRSLRKNLYFRKILSSL